MEYLEHLNMTKRSRIIEFKDRYYELMDENNTVVLEIDPTQVTPPVSKLRVKCGIKIISILDLYSRQLKATGKESGFLVNYDGGALPYVIKTDEYVALVGRLSAKSVAIFEEFCHAQQAILSAANVEDIYKVVYPPVGLLIE